MNNFSWGFSWYALYKPASLPPLTITVHLSEFNHEVSPRAHVFTYLFIFMCKKKAIKNVVQL